MTAALVGMLVDERKLALGRSGRQAPAVVPAQGSVGDARDDACATCSRIAPAWATPTILWYGQRHSTARDPASACGCSSPAYSLRSGFIYQNVMYAAAGRGGGGRERRAVGGDHADAHLRAARHARHHCHRGDARRAAERRVAALRSSTARCASIENVSVDRWRRPARCGRASHDMAKWMQMLLDGGRGGATASGCSAKRRSASCSRRRRWSRRRASIRRRGSPSRIGRPTASAGFSRTTGDAPSTSIPAASTAWWRCRAHPRRAARRLRARQPRSRRAAPRADVHRVRPLRGPVGPRLERRAAEALWRVCSDEAAQDAREDEAQRVTGHVAVAAARSSTPAPSPTRCTATSSVTRGRRAAGPLRPGVRRAAGALALQHVPREVGGRVARHAAGDLHRRANPAGWKRSR